MEGPLERNLVRLLTRCHVPARAGDELRARCLAAVLGAAAAAPRRARERSRLLAAAVLVAASALAFVLWRSERHAGAFAYATGEALAGGTVVRGTGIQGPGVQWPGVQGPESAGPEARGTVARGTVARGTGAAPIRIVSAAGDSLELLDSSVLRVLPGSSPDVEVLGGRIFCCAMARGTGPGVSPPLLVRLAASTVRPALQGCVFEVFSIQDETMNAKSRKWLLGAGALGIGFTAVAVYSGALDWVSGEGPGLRVRPGETALMPAAGAPALHGSRAPDDSTATSRAAEEVGAAPGVRTAVVDRLVSGRVEAAGLPLAGARVELVRLEGQDDGVSPVWEGSAGVFGLPGRRAALATKNTGADGSFRFDSLEDGRYLLRAWREPHAEHQGSVFGLDPKTPRHEAKISLAPGFVIQGVVFSGAARSPVAGALVMAVPRTAGSPLREPRTAPTDAAGQFSIAGLPEGRYFVCVRAEGYDTASQDSVPHDSPPIRFELEPLTGISGVVLLAADRSPVPKFTVVARKVERGQIHPAPIQKDFTPPDGRFHFPALAAGLYKVFVVAKGLATEVHETATSGAGAGNVLLFELTEGGRVEGRVLAAATKAPVPKAVVWTEEDVPPDEAEIFEVNAFLAGEHGFRAETDAEGRFTLKNVRPGKATIVARHPGSAMARREDVVVRPGGATQVELLLTAGGAIAGRVLDPDRAARKTAIYVVPQADEDPPGVYGKHYVDVESDGTYRVDKVTAGAYAVVKIDPEAGPGLDNVEVRLTVVEDGKTSTVDFVAGEGSVRLEVLVVDQAGRPQPDHTLVAVPFGGAGQMATKTTDVNGRAVFTDVKAARLGLYQQKGFGLSMLLKEVIEVPPGTKTLQQKLVLDETGFTGTAVKDQDGRPITNGTVHLFRMLQLGDQVRRGYWGGKVPTEKDGSYVIRSLAPGSYYVCVTAPGFGQELSKVFDLDANKVVDLGETRLKRGGSVTVRVLDRSGEPVNGAIVIVMDDMQRSIGISPMPITVTGGVVHGPGIKPGKYMAGSVLQGRFIGPVPFEVTEGARAEVTVKEP